MKMTEEITNQNKQEQENKDVQYNEGELLNKIEAALFLAARFLTLDELVSLTAVNPIMLKEILSKLESRYNKKQGAIIIIKKNVENVDYWKMDIKQTFSNYVNKLASGKSEFTKAEQGTLAVIAYKQPIKQSVIVKIRGNKAYDHIKHFKQNDLVKARRLGRTFELNLSDKFYDYFNVRKAELEEKNKEIDKEFQELKKEAGANNKDEQKINS